MSYADIIQPSAMLGYNYSDATSNGNTVLWFFDWDSGTGRYKGAAAMTENTDGTLTFWFYDQNFEDKTSVYGDYFQFTWSIANGSAIDGSAPGGQQALVVSTGPIPKLSTNYSIRYPYSSIQNFPNTNQIYPSYDAVNIPTPSDAVGVTDGAQYICVFRCRFKPTGAKGTVLHLANVSHYENAHTYNKTFNDSAGPFDGPLDFTLQGKVLYPVITSVSPSKGDRGGTFTLTGTNFSGDYAVFFNDIDHPAVHNSMTSTSVAVTVPENVNVGAATIFLDNGKYQSNSVNFQVTGATLASPYSNELTLNFPKPLQQLPSPLLTAVSVQPASTTVTEGQSIQFTATGTFSDGSHATLATNVTWSVVNQDGIGSIDPNTGFFTGQAAGHVQVKAAAPIATATTFAQGAAALAGNLNALTGTAQVTVAQKPPPVVTLQQIKILPQDPTIYTGGQLQLACTGVYSNGTTGYPKVTWSVQNGLQRSIVVPPDPSGFKETSTLTTLASAGQLEMSGQILTSLQGSYLSSTEFYWMEWQVTNLDAASAAGKGYGPAITDGTNRITANFYNANGGLWYNGTQLGTLGASSENVATQHTFLLGVLLASNGNMRVIAYIDELKVIDTTIAASTVALYYPQFYADAPGTQVYIKSFRTFYSSQASIDGKASIDQYGLLSATQGGQVTVFASATDGSGVQGYSDVTITDPVTITQPPYLAGFAVNPPNAVCPAGSNVQFTATALDQYGNPYPVSVVWSVANYTGAGQIDAQSGVFTGQTAGNHIVVTAVTTDGSNTSASANVIVVAGPITKIGVSPSSTLLQVGQGQQFTATGYDRYNNAVVLNSVIWTVVGGTGTISSSGLFTASTAGVGKAVATQGTLQGTATVNVLQVVGQVIVDTTPQQPFARIRVQDAVDVPLLIDSRVRGGGLRSATQLDISDQFWWDLSTYDGIPFQMYGAYAASASVAGGQDANTSETLMQAVFSKYAAPQFLGLVVPGSSVPATSL